MPPSEWHAKRLTPPSSPQRAFQVQIVGLLPRSEFPKWRPENRMNRGGVPMPSCSRNWASYLDSYRSGTSNGPGEKGSTVVRSEGSGSREQLTIPFAESRF